jgi:hypothetical protein
MDGFRDALLSLFGVSGSVNDGDPYLQIRQIGSDFADPRAGFDLNAPKSPIGWKRSSLLAPAWPRR